ncbi:MAG TPA: retron Ec67 family RNA-directed DNA polymerase/endonuclease [Candidatus Baltobacteraceae bacterium]|jgi:retron-type reverse transcriptase
MSNLSELKATKTLRGLATLLGHNAQTLSYILYKIPPESKYQTFLIPKRSGGQRSISAPTEKLKRLQRNLADLLQDCAEELAVSKKRIDYLSHGFTRQRSIVSNARMHRGRRWVLNLDLQDFFPTFNFGRVRGFLIKNRDFELNPYIATLIAQIACHDGRLPQGSPCSPVLANLIAHVLDMRIVALTRTLGVRYSRYADDLTFSTNKRQFPSQLAVPKPDDNGAATHAWVPGDELRGIIERAAFRINEQKTNMMYCASRQEVTGLVVNRAIRAQHRYRHGLRAMVHKLVRNGTFDVFGIVHKDGTSVMEKREGTVKQLHGMLGFSDFITNDSKAGGPQPFGKHSSSDERTYRTFLFYSMFYAPDRPVILCEGGTDSIYLTYAIKRLAAEYPDLLETVDGKMRRAIKIFEYRDSSTGRLLNLNEGGSDVLKKFLYAYRSETKNFGPGLQRPVIVLFDHDRGATELRKAIKNFTAAPDLSCDFPSVHVIKNVYAVPIPGENSKIEDLFKPETKNVIIRGKSFDSTNQYDTDGFYGKMIFAREVVAPHYETIDFSGFRPLLNNILSVIREHRRLLVTKGFEPSAL